MDERNAKLTIKTIKQDEVSSKTVGEQQQQMFLKLTITFLFRLTQTIKALQEKIAKMKNKAGQSKKK